MSKQKQPSAWEALTSSDAVVNLRCAAKYLMWVGSYALLLTCLVIGKVGSVVLDYAIAGLFVVGRALGRVIPGSRIEAGIIRFIEGVWNYVLHPVFSSIDDALDRIARSKRTMRVLRAVAAFMYLAAFAIAIGLVGYLVYILYTQAPGVLAFIVGALTFTAVLMYVFDYITNETDAVETASKRVSGAKKRAVDTPGVRRVYGECPVSMEMKPTWFKKLERKL